MAQKTNYREIGMDTMERLYYERQNERKLAYAAKKRKKTTTKKAASAEKPRMKYSVDVFDRTPKQSIYNMC